MKTVIVKRLNANNPIKLRICKTSTSQDHVYPHKFQGKPVNILPLKNSNIEKTKENNNIKYNLFSQYLPTIKIDEPKNKDKNSGINITEKGIKLLKDSSWVKEIEIQ